MKISAAIITKNEERNIGRCLNSVKKVADEIIVMDAGSTDQTEIICRNHGARFIKQDWLGYAQQKNLLNQQATHPFILSIDADEELSEELIAEIIQLKSTQTEGVFSFNRLTNYCGSWIYHSGWYPDIKVRLFPKEIKWIGDLVHETLDLPANTNVIPLKGHLNHFSYYSHEQHRARADHYSTLTAQKYVQQNKTVYFGQPLFSAIGRFLSMYIIKKGFLDGAAGFHIARISAASNYFKYKEVIRLKRENRKH